MWNAITVNNRIENVSYLRWRVVCYGIHPEPNKQHICGSQLQKCLTAKTTVHGLADMRTSGDLGTKSL